jgi:hypothetical protein
LLEPGAVKVARRVLRRAERREALGLSDTSASRHAVDRLVVVNLGQDYRDVANAGRPHSSAARVTARPA